MKYAFMTFSCPELTLDKVLATAKQYGYDAVEPRIDSNHKHGVELDADAATRREIRQKALDGGIALCCIATSCTYADPARVKDAVEDTLRAIDLAADVGAPRIRVFGGLLPEGVSREDATNRLINSMNSAADRAEARGVVVCMETHDDWCDPADLARVLSAVNKPSIAANWDIMHPVLRAGKTMDEAFETLKPWIRHVHCHDGVAVDGKTELRTIGEGIVDHRRALELLKSMPYDGWVSGEWIEWAPYDVHLPRELAALKRLEAEV